MATESLKREKKKTEFPSSVEYVCDYEHPIDVHISFSATELPGAVLRRGGSPRGAPTSPGFHGSEWMLFMEWMRNRTVYRSIDRITVVIQGSK